MLPSIGGSQSPSPIGPSITVTTGSGSEAPSHLQLTLRGRGSENEGNTPEERLVSDAIDNLQESVALYDDASQFHNDTIANEQREIEGNQDRSQHYGRALIKQLETLHTTVSILKTVAKVTIKENTALVTTGTTIVGGIVNLVSGVYSGSLPQAAVGGTQLVSAANEMRKMYERSGDQPDPAGLVKDSQVGVAMIQQLEEFQEQSLRTIESEISIALEGLAGVETTIEGIGEISAHGSAIVEEKKKEAMELSKQAAGAFLQASSDLKNSKIEIMNAAKILVAVTERLRKLADMAKENSSESNLQNFIREVEQITGEMEHALNMLSGSQKISTSGLQELQRASALYREAGAKYGEGLDAAQSRFHEIQKEAQTKNLQQVKETLDKAKKETEIAQQRLEAQKKVSEYTQDKLQDLQKETADQFGTQSMIVGLAAGAFTGSLLFAVVTPAAAALYHYSKRLLQHASQAAHPTTTNQPAATISQDKLVEAKYSEKSSGWGGWVIGESSRMLGGQGRPSHTVGTVVINIGNNEALKCNFNKKSADANGKMSAEDIQKLSNILLKKLQAKALSPEECLRIINALANVEIEHETVTMISADAPLLGLLRLECEIAMKNKKGDDSKQITE
jgi:hypothetical protein